MNYCKYCMRQIDDDVLFCPACGKPQKGSVKKPIYKRWWFWVIVVILFFGFIGGSSEPEIVSSTGAGTVQNSSNTPQYFTTGDTARMNDVYVTFESASMSLGSDFFQPADGNCFVICEFTIENKSSTELNISSLACFEAYVDDYSTSLSITAESSVEKDSLDGTIAPGKKMRGIIGYEVPRNWKVLEIYFNPDFWSTDQDFVFAVTQ